jgi:hypothetical protein
MMLARPNNASSALKLNHRVVECSGSGFCDQSSGVCECYKGFAGRACERSTCYGEPDDTCSGHGQCLSIKQLSKMKDAFPLADSTYVYGPMASDAKFWDEGRAHACHCDSGWPVGLGAGETQEAEYFGPGCERRHCPSGNDPATSVDETDCFNSTAKGGIAIGERGNLCHVDCSNRGDCDYDTGMCICHLGFTGHNCGTITPIM